MVRAAARAAARESSTADPPRQDAEPPGAGERPGGEPEASTPREAAPDADGEGPRIWRAELLRFVELFAVCGLAVAQPVLDIYGKNAGEFVTRRISAVDGLLFGLTILLLPPLVLLLVTAPLRLISEKVLRVAHHVLLAVLLGITIVEVLKGAPTPVRWLVGLVVAGVATYLLLRVALARQWVRFLAPAPIIFLCLFLFASEASEVMLYGATSTSALSGVQVDSKTPVVMVVFDQLPTVSLLDGKGNIDATAFPNFAELAKGSTWYRNFTSVSPSTTTAVPAILTGKYPHENTAVASKYPFSLFTMLGGQYRMNVQESATKLCPNDVCARIDGGSNRIGGVTELSQSAGRIWVDSFTAAPVPAGGDEEKLEEFAGGADGVEFHDPARFRSFESSLTDAPSTLNFMHVILPHYPWKFLPSGRTYESEKDLFPGSTLYRWDTEAAANAARQRHLLQLKYTDEWLGKLIAKVKAVGLWDKALIVVTADHGGSFQKDQPVRGVTEKNAYEIMWSPLFIRGPGFRPGRIDERAATSVDILPTIADVLKVSPQFDFDGVSTLTKVPADLPKRYVHKSSHNDLPAARNDYSTVDAAPNYKKVKEAPAAGSGGDDLHFFRTGPSAALIGQKVDQIPQVAVGDPRDETATFDAPGATRTFNASGPTAPAYVTGDVPGYRGGLLLTVNGIVIGSSTLTERDNGEFGFLIPDTRMNEGENRLALYSVDVQGLRITLRPFKSG